MDRNGLAHMSSQIDIWHLLKTDSGKPYYYNRAKQVTQWERPDGYIIDVAAEEAAQAAAEGRTPEQARKEQQRPSLKLARRNSFAEMLRSVGERVKGKSEKSAGKGAESAGAESAKSGGGKKAGNNSASRHDPTGPEEKLVTSPLPKARRGSERQGSGSGSASRGESERSSRGSAPSTPVWRWTKMQTATFGSGASTGGGEVYYVNEDGETQWERPVDYESENEALEREETSEICFARDQSVHAILVELGALTSNGSADDSEMAADRAEMLARGADEGRKCEKRLRQIFLAIKYCGTPDEWEAAAHAAEFALVRGIYLHWGRADRTPSAVRSLTCVLLETFVKLDSSLIRHYVDGEWGLDPVDFLANAELGLQEASPDETSLFSWLSLLYSFLTEVPRLPAEALPAEDTIAVLVAAMGARDQDVFLMATYVILALNSHYGFTANQARPEAPETGEEDMAATLGEEPNLVLHVVQADRKNGELFGEAVLHLLNTQSFPYDDPVLLGQILYFLRAVFSTRATSEFFHTNDLKVMVDITLLQLANLPPEDEFRCDYIRILHLIVLCAPAWRKYRRADILDALDNVLQGAGSGMLPAAQAFATRVLLDCINYLS